MSNSDVNSGQLPVQHKVSHSVFKSAAEIAQDVKKERIPTGSNNLDDLLNGGLEMGAITQFYGSSNTGKSHLCHLLCVGLPSTYQAIYVDTEGGFRTERIRTIAEARELDYSNILQNIHVAQPKNSREQELCIKEASSVIKSSNSKIKLLIVDSIMHHYKGEYPGRSKLAERAHRLNTFLHILSTVADENGIAVVLTNQVYSSPRPNSEADKLKPIGGNAVYYASKYVISIEYMDYENRRAVLEKSPSSGYASCYLMMHKGGFIDKGPPYLDESDFPTPNLEQFTNSGS